MPHALSAGGRFMRPFCLATALLVLSGSGQAQEDEAIVTDRPDFVESSDVVGAGRFQLETSIAQERSRGNGLRSRLRSTPTLLRLGVSETLELRLETEGWLHLREDGPEGTQRRRGMADTALGLKWHWQDGDEASGRPGTAWLLHLDGPTGSREFRGQGWRPSLRLVAEWELAGGWSAGVMPGLFRERDEQGRRYWGGILAGVLGRQLGEGLRGFVELAGQQLAPKRHGGQVWTADTGLAWQLQPWLQLDLALFRGLTRESPDWGWTLGLSIKR